MPIVPDLLERALIGRLNVLPGILLDYAATLAFRAAIVASRLGIYDALAARPLTTAEVAGATATDARAVAQLLGALRTLGYLQRLGSTWSLTPQSRRWLTSSSPDSIVTGLPFLEWNALTIWDELEGAVRAGGPRRPLYEVLEASPGRSADFQAWDRIAGILIGQHLVGRMPIPSGPRRLLDLGGGNGIFSLLLCRRHAGLTATIVDLPGALGSAEPAIDEAGLRDRISTRAGDFLVADLGVGFDVVLVANVLHGLSAHDGERLIRRAAGALGPGGVLLVVDQDTNSGAGAATTASTALLDLGYLVALGGGSWPVATIRDWLRRAGLVDLRTFRTRRAPGNVIVAGWNR
ncbi:MAG: class I SAM-dependent methyltransferase [Chloroflexota bacterium]